MSITNILPAASAADGVRAVAQPMQDRPRPIWQAKPGYLFHPFVDFLLAGGASIPCAAIVFYLLGDTSALAPKVLTVTSAAQIAINFPHFAHSYQLLYGGYLARFRARETDRLTRLRYFWAGIAAPLLLVGFFAYAISLEDSRVLGYAVNAMSFFVGWHYVKQGYGVLIVLSVVRRLFFSTLEKYVLLVNAYAIWICSWMRANQYLAEDRRWGLSSYTFDMPDPLVELSKYVAAITTIAFVVVILRRVLLEKKPISINGLVGYCCAIYLWLLAAGVDLVFLYIIPAFHSVQYLLFVWRFQLNRAQLQPDRRRWEQWLGSDPRRRAIGSFLVFILVGGVMGWLGFRGLPHLLDASIAYDAKLWSAALFVFIATMFINIHHYFIDNVIWRKGNDEVRRFLFAS